MSKEVNEKAVDIEEALERTDFGKFNFCIIVFAGLVLKNVILESVGVSFALPVLECDLRLSHVEQGVIGAVAFAGIIVSSHFWGFLADTIGRKRIMQPALIFGYIVTIFSSLSPNFISFAILRFFSGIFIKCVFDILIRMTEEKATELPSFGKINVFVIIFSGVVLFNVLLESVGVSFALPILECDMHLSHMEEGVLGTVAFAGVIASSLFWGFLADTMGRKCIMQPALILGFIVTACSSLSPNFVTFAILRFLSGILLSASSATIFAYVGEFHCHKYRDRAILYGALISAISAIFFPIIAWIFINQNWEFHIPLIDITFKPWRSYFVACGLPGFLCGLAMFYLPESPKYLLAAGKPDEALQVLELMYRMNNKDKETDFKITSLIPDSDVPIAKVKGFTKDENLLMSILRSMWLQTAPLFMREHLRKTILSSLILYVIFFCAHGVYMWFPYILNFAMQYTEKYSEPKTLCDIIKFKQLTDNLSIADDNVVEECVTSLEISTYKHTIMLELIYVSVMLVIMYAISKVGRKPILFMVLFVCGASGILAFSIKLPLLAIYLFVINLCCGLGIAVVNAIVVEIFPTNLRAMAVCISLMIGRIGSVSGSNILGALIETHCEIALYSPSVALIVAGVLGLFLPKANNATTTKKELENMP